jgi:hypothetical protein
VSEPAFAGLDLLVPPVGIAFFPLGSLPSLIPIFSDYLPTLRGSVAKVFLLGIEPPDRDVWSSDATRRTVGVLRRSSSLLAGPNGVEVKVGWCDEADLGRAVRRILRLHE